MLDWNKPRKPHCKRAQETSPGGIDLRPKNLEKLKNYIGLKQFEQVASRTINKWQLRSKDLKQGKKSCELNRFIKPERSASG